MGVLYYHISSICSINIVEIFGKYTQLRERLIHPANLCVVNLFHQQQQQQKWRNWKKNIQHFLMSEEESILTPNTSITEFFCFESYK